MSSKVKIFVFAMAIIAIFSVRYFFLSFTNINGGNLNNPTTIADVVSEMEPDTDGDGLSDTQESLWNTDFQNADSDGDGYLDGEEITSGHNPLIKGPNDLLDPQELKNVTRKVSNLITAGLIEGSLQSNNPNYEKSVDEIVQEIIIQSERNLADIPRIHLETIEPTKENIDRYGHEISPILERIAEDNPKGLERLFRTYQSTNTLTDASNPEFKDFFTKEIAMLNGQAHQLEKVKVPTTWAENQRYLIALIYKTAKSYEMLLSVEADPYQSIVALSSLINLLLRDLNYVMSIYASVYKQ